MDETVSARASGRLARSLARSLARLLTRWMACALARLPLLLLAGAAAAQALNDPTRPPAQLSAAGAEAAEAAPVVVAPQLQSVLIGRGPGPDARRIAVIDGQTVRLGGKFRGDVLIGMSDTEVVLLHGRERQVLKLFPDPATSVIPPKKQLHGDHDRD